jgi:phosphoglycolate phosphatase-like HAD superfamily hydrolase
LYDVYLDRWLERIEEPNYLALDAVQDGAADRLAEWRASGVRLVLVTLRRNRKNLLWQLSDRGILSLFDEVLSVGSDAVDADKAEAVRGCCAGETAACLWVGDSEVDVAAARKLGIPICAVTCGVRSPEYLRGVRPDFLVASLSGVMLLEITPS